MEGTIHDPKVYAASLRTELAFLENHVKVAEDAAAVTSAIGDVKAELRRIGEKP
jgi:uncharacterized hydantoinase/oxoprolinase family protein